MTTHHVRTYEEGDDHAWTAKPRAYRHQAPRSGPARRARAFYRDKLGLEPVEERTGGLRYVCGPTEFHLFRSAGAPSGTSTQMAFEVEDLETTLAELRARG
jgi:catechol 2,3-dioxygenase-like lactoylglutathione lyase family enzyme